MTAPPLAAVCYLYGVVPAGATPPAGAVGVGDPGGAVSLLPHAEIAALVSEVPADRSLGTRRDLLRHSGLLDGIARSAPVLPMRFGTVLEDHAMVLDELLVPHRRRFAEALAALDGQAQFTVKASYVEAVVLREVLAEEPEIARLRDALRERPAEMGYGERIHLGELVALAVERRREADAAALLDELSAYARALTWAPATTRDGIVDAALLVDRQAWPALEEAADRIARRGAGRLRLRLLGPLAPYDFSRELMGEPMEEG